MNSLNTARQAVVAGVARWPALVYLVGYVGVWQWMVCRVEVPPGYSLLLRYKGPWPFGVVPQAPEGTLVKTDAQRPAAPGRHPRGDARPGPAFLLAARVRDRAGQGPDHPARQARRRRLQGRQAAARRGVPGRRAEGYRGIRRRVLTPGRYRINTYAYDVRVVDVDACVEPRHPAQAPERRPDADPAGLRRRRDQQDRRPEDRPDAGHPEGGPPARHLLPQPRGEAGRHHQRRLQRDDLDGRGRASRDAAARPPRPTGCGKRSAAKRPGLRRRARGSSSRPTTAS